MLNQRTISPCYRLIFVISLFTNSTQIMDMLCIVILWFREFRAVETYEAKNRGLLKLAANDFPFNCHNGTLSVPIVLSNNISTTIFAAKMENTQKKQWKRKKKHIDSNFTRVYLQEPPIEWTLIAQQLPSSNMLNGRNNEVDARKNKQSNWKWNSRRFHFLLENCMRIGGKKRWIKHP